MAGDPHRITCASHRVEHMQLASCPPAVGCFCLPREGQTTKPKAVVRGARSTLRRRYPYPTSTPYPQHPQPGLGLRRLYLWAMSHGKWGRRRGWEPPLCTTIHSGSSNSTPPYAGVASLVTCACSHQCRHRSSREKPHEEWHGCRLGGTRAPADTSCSLAAPSQLSHVSALKVGRLLG
jgi:hypothetical protein